MKRIKQVFSTIGLCLGLTLGAKAQNVQYILSGTQTIPAGLSNVTTFVGHMGREISVQATFNLTGAGTSGVACILEASNDNANWATTPVQFWRAGNGATPVLHLTNFTINASPFFRLTTHNTNSTIVTNVTLTIVNKTGV